MGLAGSQTAGLAVNGGPAVNSVQHFNGSSWSEGGDYPTAQDRTGVFGTQTAAVAFGGVKAVDGVSFEIPALCLFKTKVS